MDFKHMAHGENHHFFDRPTKIAWKYTLDLFTVRLLD